MHQVFVALIDIFIHDQDPTPDQNIEFAKWWS
jgi:hypothetical protein